MTGPTRSGLLLAGGRSTRFDDGDKALAPLAGAPLVAHAAAALAPAVDELVVNCRADQRDPLREALGGIDERVRFAVDPVPDEGPVAGLVTGLRVTRGRYAVVAACDQPFLRTATVERLFERAEEPGGDGAAPLIDGRREPLGAVYRVDRTREAAERTLAAGSRRLRDTLARVDPPAVSVPPATTLDIDTRDELTDVQSKYGGNPDDNARNMEIIDESAILGGAAGTANGAANDTTDAAGTTATDTVTGGPAAGATRPAGPGGDD